MLHSCLQVECANQSGSGNSTPSRLSGGLLFWGVCVLMGACLSLVPTSAQAQLTPEHRRELTNLRREITKAASLIRRKDFDEAKQLLDDSEKAIKDIMSNAGLDEQDNAIAGLMKALNLQRQQLDRSMNPGGGKEPQGISFSKEIAPILAARCMGCHGDNNPRGGLRLNNFAGMRQGGGSGPLLVPGNAQRSMLAMRLVAPGQQRMPRGQDQLPQAEITKIATWINQGARYDHDDPSTLLTDLGKEEMKKPKVEVQVAKPDGSETVSFKKDIAPIFVTFCVGCHSGNNPRSGFSVENFEKILIGGDSGEVLIPGKLEESRLFRLTGGLENPRMPQGQARITRKNYEDLKKWIEEGIKFDGDDPKQLLREMVPTDEEVMAQRLREMDEPAFRKYRQEKAEGHWRRTLSSAKPISISTDPFLLMGNVDSARLGEVSSWAEAMLGELQSRYNLKESPSWRGRLAIYVFKDRYDYDEFNRSIENRAPADTLFGHARVTENFNEAYIAVLDTGDVATASKPSLRWTLFKSLNSAYWQINARTRPLWLTEGSGWALADSAFRSDDYEKTMKSSAAEVLRNLRRVEDLFQNGTFAPDATEHVGFVVTRFLLTAGNQEQFRRFARLIVDGRNVNEACREVYKATAADLAQSLRKAL